GAEGLCVDNGGRKGIRRTFLFMQRRSIRRGSARQTFLHGLENKRVACQCDAAGYGKRSSRATIKFSPTEILRNDFLSSGVAFELIDYGADGGRQAAVRR